MMRKNNDTSWGKVANWYDSMITDKDSYQQQVLLPNLTRLLDLKSSDRVLDVACGTGFFSGVIAEKAKVIGIDIGKPLIEIAKKKYPKAEFFVGEAKDMVQLNIGSFSKVIIVLALQNIAEVKKTLEQISGVLAPGGKVFIVLNHPAFRIPKRSGWQWDGEGTQFRRIDGYLHESKEEIMMHPGSESSTTTLSFHRPLQYYFKLFSATGFVVSRLEEWISHRKSESGPRQKEEDRMRSEIPLFLCLELISAVQ